MTLLATLADEIVRLTRGHRGVKVEVADDVFVTCEDVMRPPAPMVTEPSLALVARGVKRTIVDERAIDYRAGQFLVTSLDLPVRGQAVRAHEEEPLAVVSMPLRADDIAPLLDGPPRATTSDPWPGLAVSDAPGELLDAVLRLLRVCDRPADLRVLGPGLRREVTWRLLTGPQGPLVEQIGLRDGNLARVAAVVRRLREHSTEPVVVEDLARLAGMSASALHRHFRAATSTTPIRFQKVVRLHRARDLLLGGEATVAAVAHRVGYGSASQFSADYRRLFGTPPGASRRRST